MKQKYMWMDSVALQAQVDETQLFSNHVNDIPHNTIL